MIFGGLSTIEFINVVRIKDDDYFQKIMEFKKSEIPKDAVSTTEIDSIAKFLAHVSIFDLVIKNDILSSFILLD